MGKIKSKVYSLGKKRKLTLVWKSSEFSYLKVLTFGYAISNPEDKFDKNLGITIATSRLEHVDARHQECEILFETARFIPTEVQEQFADSVAETMKANLPQYVKALR